MNRLTIEERHYLTDTQKALEERIADKLEYSDEEERDRWLNEEYDCPNGDHFFFDSDEEILGYDFTQYLFLSECMHCDTYKLTSYFWDEEASQKEWEEMEAEDIDHDYEVRFPEHYIDEEDILSLSEICEYRKWQEDWVRKVPNKYEVVKFNSCGDNSANYLDETTDIKLSTKLKEETRVNPS